MTGPLPNLAVGGRYQLERELGHGALQPLGAGLQGPYVGYLRSRIQGPGHLATRVLRSSIVLVLAALAAPRLQAQEPPRTPFVARGACPFECCQLGAWTARDTLPVFDRERAGGSPRFLFLPGDGFRADSADFYTLALGLIRARRPFSLLDYLAARDSASRAAGGLASLRAPLAAGDSIFLVGEVSEEGELVWARGTTAVVEPFWAEGSDADSSAPAVLIRPIVHEWWVHVTAHDRSGWIQAWNRRIDGTDACA